MYPAAEAAMTGKSQTQEICKRFFGTTIPWSWSGFDGVFMGSMV
jgi:hypothetical protein